MTLPAPAPFAPSTPAAPGAPRRATVLLAKSSITGAATRELAELAARLQALAGAEAGPVVHAFSEQGTPTLREAVLQLAEAGVDELRILPVLLPMEPGFRVWIDRALNRWRAEQPQRPWPRVLVGPGPAGLPAMDALLLAMARAPAQEPVPTPASALHTTGSVVPAQAYRVLVCQGGPCNNAGAGLLWGHLRNEQKRLNLRSTGGGTMTARTSCLGPCNLAPVVQVFPQGTCYGGVDEAGIDAIVQRHLLGGEVVAALAYAPLPHKQPLRTQAPQD